MYLRKILFIDLNIVNIPKLINYDKDKKIMTTENYES